jgi:hypothetical protein
MARITGAGSAISSSPGAAHGWRRSSRQRWERVAAIEEQA